MDNNKAHLAGCPVSVRHLRLLLKADLIRYAGRPGAKAFLRHFLFTPGFKYTVWMRSCGWAKRNRMAKRTVYPILKFLLLHCRYKYGIAIPEYTLIGPGLFINRFGGIYMHGDTVIGANVNITHGAMLGYSNRGKYQGAPILGDRVFIASGGKAIGRVSIGDEVAIGVNSVVTKDVPFRGVVGGVPARLLSEGGTEGYINQQAPQALVDECIALFGGRAAFSRGD